MLRGRACHGQSCRGGHFLIWFSSALKVIHWRVPRGNSSPAFNKNTVVIPLLNGVNSAERLRAVLPQATVISGSVYIISHIEKPGIINQEGGACRLRLTFGTDDESVSKYQYILDILLQAKINAILTTKSQKFYGQNTC